jgi:hypothetical protein
MGNRNYHFLILISLLSITCILSTAGSEVLCSSAVSFSINHDSKLKNLFYKNIQTTSSSKEIGTQSLKTIFEKRKRFYMTECSQSYESVTSCIKQKFSEIARTSTALDFKSKTTLRREAIKDCKLKSGVCEDVILAEPACAEIVAPVTNGTPSPSSSK